MATLEGVAREELKLSITHGTNKAYLRDKCRCEECKEAHREVARAYKKRVKSARWPTKHGTNWAYRGQGCRCKICVAGEKKRNREKYLRKLQGDKVVPRPRSRITQEQLDRALYHLKDGCSYLESARTVGVSQRTLMSYFPGYKGQGRLNMVEINSKPELKALHDEIWNMKL